MRIDILTVVPELLESPLGHSIVGRAIKKGLVEIQVHNIRKYGIGPRATVDDYCYGGDAGMVMMIEPVEKMIEDLKSERDYDEIIYLSRRRIAQPKNLQRTFSPEQHHPALRPLQRD